MNTFIQPKHNKLGIIYSTSSTKFRVWAPIRNKIKLLIYENYNHVRRREYPMYKDTNGIFSAEISGNLDGKYYTYLIDDMYEVTDPYSIASSINSEKSAIINLELTDPEGFREHASPNIKYKEAIIYEVHVKDYSVCMSSGTLNRGKYLGFIDNKSNYKGFNTGIEHLKELGITHVHLLPIADFITVREEPGKFLNSDNYNWGYDPELYNVPEGSYSSNPYDPKSRIYELKKLIMELHKAGIAVVLDVVYNHTYRTNDSNFNTLMPGYYYRKFNGAFSNGSGCGNELATEKTMTRKFIIESLKYWQDEYRIDGFRFDLMALIDNDTIYEAIDELRKHDPNILIYGEPWTAQSSPLPLNKRSGFGSQRNRNFGIFNPYFRDAIKGDGDGVNRGYVQGDGSLKNKIETGIIGSINMDKDHIGFCAEPDETINYYNSHDNLIITDKLKLWFGDVPELEDMSMLSMSIIMTSQGIPFIHAGNEFLRDKKLVSNSYNSDLSVNGINWENKKKYLNIFKHSKDIIAIRKQYLDFFTLNASEIRRSIRFVQGLPDHVIAYTIKRKDAILLIIHNSGWDKFTLNIANTIEKLKVTNKNNKYKKTEIFNKTGKVNKIINDITKYKIDRISTSIVSIENE
ncbi:type I pullulanase [Microaceticoccus formicicus]|uniref:type I pullulanase n=1 Tax=Microaceticoccus formicicus TaxID=3118105 RepID=UPI003CD03644|nr:type I pullulanase [Peptoniphilaceae bacterium AMB_02]